MQFSIRIFLILHPDRCMPVSFDDMNETLESRHPEKSAPERSTPSKTTSVNAPPRNETPCISEERITEDLMMQPEKSPESNDAFSSSKPSASMSEERAERISAGMPVLEDIYNLGKGCILLGQKHQEMINKICSLSKEQLLIIILCLDYKLNSFLSDLLCNLVQAS